MVARAMLNCGLEDLRLVRPRDGWPNPAAVTAAAGADVVLEKARLYDRTEDAVAALRRVYATTARPRDMVKDVITPRQAAQEMAGLEASDARGQVGVLFGPERSGLVNDDLALADQLLVVPLNPGFSSLNLAQAVLIIGYECYAARSDGQQVAWPEGAPPPASKAELYNFFDRLEGLLEEKGFFHPPEKTPGMKRNLRNIFQRMVLTEQDLRTFHGIISALISRRHRDQRDL